ncbi:MAG: ankyrin repeat domain-containing protein [Pontiellaceae bacterium]|nr:ankyrin repeat domain-containing protein [Pontiellaceae bacterium]
MKRLLTALLILLCGCSKQDEPEPPEPPSPEEVLAKKLLSGVAQPMIDALYSAFGIDQQALADQYNFSSLHQAVANGDVEEVKFQISIGADVTAQDINGRSPLHYSSQSFVPKITSLLLDAGSDINQRDNDGNTLYSSP